MSDKRRTLVEEVVESLVERGYKGADLRVEAEREVDGRKVKVTIAVEWEPANAPASIGKCGPGCLHRKLDESAGNEED